MCNDDDLRSGYLCTSDRSSITEIKYTNDTHLIAIIILFYYFFFSDIDFLSV